MVNLPIILGVGGSPVTVITSIFKDVRTWLVSLVLIVTVVSILFAGLKYFNGNEMEKEQALKHIKRNATMGGAIFVFVWFAAYVIEKLQPLIKSIGG